MFFFAQTENEKTLNIFGDFFNVASDEDSDKDLIQQDIQQTRNERQQKWGWLLIAKNVADWQNTIVKDVLNSNCYEVLTYATLVKEEVEFIQSQSTQHGR